MKDETPSAASDWQAMRHRLARAHEMAEQTWAPTPDERDRILAERARALARSSHATSGVQAQADDLVLVTFMLGQEWYGVEAEFVMEVAPLKELTPVPCTPAFVRGIMNLRGRIVSVVDLKTFFEIPQQGLGELDRVVVLQRDAMEFGILVNAVPGNIRVPRRSLQGVVPTLTGIGAEYLHGITENRLIVLNAARILSDDRITVHEHVRPGLGPRRPDVQSS